MKTNRTLAYTQCKTIPHLYCHSYRRSLPPYQTFLSFGRLLFISRRYSHNIRKMKPRNAFENELLLYSTAFNKQSGYGVYVDVHYSFVPIMGKGEKLVYYNTSHTFI